jgi:hypothetical protein
MNIGKYIYAKLIATPAIVTQVSTRIYPVLIGEKVTYPAIAYTVDCVATDKQKTGVSSHDSETVTFHIWADIQQGSNGYEKVGIIDELTRTAFDFTSGTAGGVIVEHSYYVSSKDIFNEERMLIGREAIYVFITKR